MKYERYDIKADGLRRKYEFVSDGPKGKVTKQILFIEYYRQPNVYILEFGDVNDDGKINNLVVTNNGDTQKILATVAFSVLKVLEAHPDKWVVFTGSTRSRTRLYRMGISKNLEEIKSEIDVFGFVANEWRAFEAGTDYEAYIVRKKNDVPL
jgi:hypothetical protein